MKKTILAIIATLTMIAQSHASTDGVKVLRKTIQFEDCRAIIIEALKMCPMAKDKSLKLLSGFLTQSAESRLENTIFLVIGESRDPMIMLQDSENNQIYVLALKTLLPEIEW
jgi:hypothetical protein